MADTNMSNENPQFQNFRSNIQMQPRGAGSPNLEGYPLRNTKYNGKASKILGILQLVFAITAIIPNSIIITMTANSFEYPALHRIGAAFWSGVPFVIAAILGIVAAKKKQTCPIVGFMAMSIISAVFSVVLLTIGIVGIAAIYDESYELEYRYNTDFMTLLNKNFNIVIIMYIFLILSALGEGITCIVSAAICCKAVCCCHQGISDILYGQPYYNRLPDERHVIPALSSEPRQIPVSNLEQGTSPGNTLPGSPVCADVTHLISTENC
ncbi:DgyrCDS523 [Dimorphilus gyrociliatus]|uniref:DgyrCDS523 n=1 Tax=Dimorphilus gyrociliatus TaxID=2664684 RepID=A0A7I8V4X7_9ANNE|nr:DgyrCDS523 [Dimorphilus gyrociliatus]